MDTPRPLLVRPSTHQVRNALILGVAAMLFFGSWVAENGMVYPLVVAGILALGAVRTVMMSLEAADRSVRIRNRWRTYNLPWADIRDVEVIDRPNVFLAAGYGARKRQVVVLTTRGKIPVLATTTVRLTKRALFGSRLTSDLDAHHAVQSGLLRRLEQWQAGGQG